MTKHGRAFQRLSEELRTADARITELEARLKEAEDKLNAEMAEHTREVLRHAVTKSRAEKAEARAEAAETARDNCSKTAIELLGSSFCDAHSEKVKQLSFPAFSEWIKQMGCLPCAIARLATALAKNERAALSPAEREKEVKKCT